MATTSDHARNDLAIARADIDRILRDGQAALEATLSEAFEEMREATVFDQHDITEAMHVAKRGTLKFNLETAQADALKRVSVELSRLDIDALSDRGSRSLQGGQFVAIGEVLSSLLKPYGDLLGSVGYRLVGYKSGASTYMLPAGREERRNADAVMAQLNDAIAKYGHAKRVLSEVEAAEGKDRARKLWSES